MKTKFLSKFFAAVSLTVVLMIALSGCGEEKPDEPDVELSKDGRVFKEENKNSFIVSYKDWKNPVTLGEPVNSNWFEDCPHITPDGKMLYLCVNPTAEAADTAEKIIEHGNLPELGIYKIERVGTGWSELKQVKLREEGTWGLDGSLHTQDGVTGYFNAKREDSEQIDIFRVNLEDGTVERLPEPVNSEYNDGEPFISVDGTKLYFASDRPGGKGQIDIWMSEFKDEAWQEPVNLGFNSMEVETEPYVTPDGKTMYFRRSRFIYEVSLEGMVASAEAADSETAVFEAAAAAADGEAADGVEMADDAAKDTADSEAATEAKMLIRSHAGLVGHPNMTEDGEYLYFSHSYYAAEEDEGYKVGAVKDVDVVRMERKR